MEQRRAAEREARRPVCQERGEKFTDQRWEETTTRDPWKTGNPYLGRSCWTDYLAGTKAAAEAARVQTAAPALAEPLQGA